MNKFPSAKWIKTLHSHDQAECKGTLEDASMSESGPKAPGDADSHRVRGTASSEWRKAQNRASQKTYREKKKRLKREKEALASRAEPSTQRAPSDQVTIKAMKNTSSETNADKDMTHGIPDEEGTRSADAVNSAEEPNRSDLCPAVTTEQSSRIVVFPEPKVRKIRTVMPFDMSDPFKFRGTQMSWEPIDMKTISVSARKMAEPE